MCNGLSTAPGTEQDRHLAVILMVLIVLYIHTILIILTFSCSHQSRQPPFRLFTVPPVRRCWLPCSGCRVPSPPSTPGLGGVGGVPCPTLSGTLGGAW